MCVSPIPLISSAIIRLHAVAGVVVDERFSIMFKL